MIRRLRSLPSRHRLSLLVWAINAVFAIGLLAFAFR
jgi:hypothetical protein